MYPPELVAPMKDELTTAGFNELTNAHEVDEMMSPDKGTVLVVVNSVCGCAAGSARPAVLDAIQNEKVPNNLTTVFAGVDTEATEQARKYMLPYPPSSPAIGLFKDGKLVHFVERHHIEGSTAEMVSDNLKSAFNEYC